MDRSADNKSNNRLNLPIFHNATVNDTIKKSNDGNSYSDIACSDINLRNATQDEFKFASKESLDKTIFDQGQQPKPIANIEIKSQGSENVSGRNIQACEKLISGQGQETSFDSIDDGPSPIRHEPIAI